MEKSKKYDEITKLTQEWYELIGKDYHKDRDCHFHIDVLWSYGNEPIFSVQHYGYLISDIDIQCASFNDALDTMILKIKEMIEEEKEWAIKRQKEEEEWELFSD